MLVPSLRRYPTLLTGVCWLMTSFSPWTHASTAASDHRSLARWKAPRSCIFTRNPVAATRISIREGKKIFDTRCAGCHGSTGHGDGPDASQLRVRPARLSGQRVQEESDGLLWWKISLGKKPMPGFGFRLSPTDRWHVINYLRTLSEQRQSS